MKKHTLIYMNFFDYVIDDFIPCEICGSKAVDIHHIEPKGLGGSKNKDFIDNLVALCRHCHNRCHSEKAFTSVARNAHMMKKDLFLGRKIKNVKRI